ncbi:MAG: 3-oxoacyl-ACP reductase FabG [Clostridia bacterium]|nr:3-oxoacyl-ACP reductase FabG [Clostridia bacterium]
MKTVIVTGGSKGIGRAIVYAFAKAGYNVILNYNTSYQSAKDIVEDLKDCDGIVEMFKADVSNRDEVDSMVEYAVKEFGKIDVLVNNAGICDVELFTDITEETWNKVLDVNLKGVFNVTQSVLRNSMINEKNGSIINISSIYGICGGSCEVAYSASKAGIVGLTKALAKELALSNINVNAVAPGAINTDMLKENYSKEDLEVTREEIPMGRFGTPDEVAELVLFLSTDNAKYITGQVISPNGGLVM